LKVKTFFDFGSKVVGANMWRWTISEYLASMESYVSSVYKAHIYFPA